MMRLGWHSGWGGRRGSVLLLVLWLVIGIGVAALSYTASVRAQFQSAQAAQGKVQAYWAARAGVEKARVLLREADLETLAPEDDLFDDEEAFKDQPVGGARFSIYVPAVEAGDVPKYGLIDEAARINLNTAPEETLLKLPDATAEMSDSLQDWRDTDGRLRPLGAELDYYEALERPTVPRDGPLYSLRELLRVRDWARLAQAAYPDPFMRHGAEAAERPIDADEREEARRLFALLTVWSRDARLAPDGKERMELPSVTAETIRQRITDLTQEQAEAIVKHRDEKQYENTIDLLEVKPAKQEGSGGNRGNRGGGGGGGANSGNEQKVFDLKKVGQIIDYFTIKKVDELGEPGLVNINTAASEVLALLPDVSEELAEKIVAQRERERFESGGRLAEVEGMTEAIFKKVYPLVTARSQCFRVLARGYEPDSGASATIEAVLAVKETDVNVVYWREN